MKIKYIVYALIVLLLAYLIYNRLNANKEMNSKGAAYGNSGADKKIVVNGIVVTTQDFSDDVSVSGSIEANEQVEIRSEISGLIKSINFKEGTAVSKGSLLVKIDDSELQAQYAQALTKQKLAKETAVRAGKLLKSEAISQEEFDNSEAELKSFQAQTQLIRAQLAKAEIRAPFSGKIGLRNVSNGAYVTPAQVIANLVSINPVKITFSIPEKYSKMVNDGSKITFTVAGTSKIFDGIIYAKEPAIDVNTRTLVIKALAENSDNFLIPGTFANVNIKLKSIKDAILIPSAAVTPILNGKQVFIVKNGKAATATITSDARTADKVIVAKGLSAGDTLITSGIMALKPGAPVEIKLEKDNK